jgi:hypothetical protein
LSKRKKAIAKRLKEGLVLDCSIVMAWYFVDESDAYADQVARQLPDRIAFVPMNWPLEVANTLIVGERRKRSTQAQAARMIAYLSAMPISVDDETNLQAWPCGAGCQSQRSTINSRPPPRSQACPSTTFID